MNENDKIDAAAQDQESWDSMVESTVDRQIFAEMDDVSTDYYQSD